MSLAKFCAISGVVALVFAFTLVGTPVHGSVACTYNVGGCGFPVSYMLEEYVTTTADDAACAALCGGRVSCYDLTPMAPWGCTY